MQVKKSVLLLAFSLFLIPFFGMASDSHESPEGGQSLKSQIKAEIQHHLMDAHDFHLFTDKETNTHYGFPLPVILIDNGLQIFSSSKFHHGESVAESNGNYYTLYHGKIYKTDESGFMPMHDGHVHNEKPLDFSITKNVFSIMVRTVN